MGNGTALPNPLTKITAGDMHTCAIDSLQHLWCWGSNALGQAGLVDVSNNCLSNDEPPGTVVFPGNLAVDEVVAKESTTCAHTVDNQVWCWGVDADGQLGSAPGKPVCMPSKVNGLAAASQLALGNKHVCALLTGSGNPVCWARNCRGQVGAEPYTTALHGNAYSLYTAPNPVQDLAGVKAISAGAYHSCALLADGSVKCWGDDGDGELGGGGSRATSPVAVALQCPQ
jgi:alpha-tubulin suppressor-like RCC1 family protein